MSEPLNIAGYSAPRAGSNARGKIETIVYFVGPDRHIILAILTTQPTPLGYERCEATTLAESDALSQAFAAQQMRKFRFMDRVEMARREKFFKGCISRARETIAKAGTSQKERDFLRNKQIPDWEASMNETKIYREFFFHAEAYEAGHGDD